MPTIVSLTLCIMHCHNSLQLHIAHKACSFQQPEGLPCGEEGAHVDGTPDGTMVWHCHGTDDKTNTLFTT